VKTETLEEIEVILEEIEGIVLILKALFVNFVAFTMKVKTGTWVFTSPNANLVQESSRKEPRYL